MNKLLLAACACLVLTGCPATTGDVLIPDGKKTVEIDKRLLTECPEPVDLKSGTDKDNLAFTETTLAALGECSIRHKGLAAIVRDAFNVKEK